MQHPVSPATPHSVRVHTTSALTPTILSHHPSQEEAARLPQDIGPRRRTAVKSYHEDQFLPTAKEVEGSSSEGEGEGEGDKGGKVRGAVRSQGLWVCRCAAWSALCSLAGVRHDAGLVTVVWIIVRTGHAAGEAVEPACA